MKEWLNEHGSEANKHGGFQLWELCSGSSVLSAAARDTTHTHVPPVDFRYGWSLARAHDQLIILGHVDAGSKCVVHESILQSLGCKLKRTTG